jgi:threonyl-tRNA synthetase
MDQDLEAANPRLFRIRHSLAHVLAQAVLKVRPGAKLGFGPAIEDGFYYDFILPEPISETDFPEIEREMKRVIKHRQAFVREDLPVAEGLARIDAMGEPYKREYAQELASNKGLPSLSFYTNGTFLDMCEGPHVENTADLPMDGFKLRSLAGAYWRGDSRNVMMTRIYAWAYETKEELDARVQQHKDAVARDHKKLGKELDIFVIDDDIGKGLPLWLPNGTVIRGELEKLMGELEFKGGYQRVATPHLAKESLYYQTGHLPYYAVHMYPPMELKEQHETAAGTIEEVKEIYRMRPMNCPHHHKVFGARLRSYRDLPLRLAEYGQLYRFEDSGALSGLLRVRGMCMNDAHIYCTEDQVESEFVNVMRLHLDVYDILGFPREKYYFRLSTWDPADPKGKNKYVDDPVAWEKSQGQIRRAMQSIDLPYVEAPGEAAFYGPKIDVQFRTVTGREETASTCQIDFAIPGRLGLTYRGADNTEHAPFVIHRAPLGTHERFVAFLLEHYAGAFPTWLAPVQARFLTVSDRFDDHARKLVAELRSKLVRAELDDSSDTVSKKIRNAANLKIPNTLVIGEREVADGTVTLRRFGSHAQRTLPFAQFVDVVGQAIASRSDAGFAALPVDAPST